MFICVIIKENNKKVRGRAMTKKSKRLREFRVTYTLSPDEIKFVQKYPDFKENLKTRLKRDLIDILEKEGATTFTKTVGEELVYNLSIVVEVEE
jgi:dissimilatory sulfite reductase (desulfoviridin) alpha/beta subunit